ncbi:MoaD/ThiS family protein [Tsuneonella rigui]|uniref:MoaD/ThiS family protein n=1 Tax=Tsuneonella rigui TaxID=1708790 RepID=UPI000F7E63F8|nr:MoaD/ThiS family protein [Tsuneonella rigui]
MSVRVVFLGRLRDLAERDEMALPGPMDWQVLLQAVPSSVRDALQDDRVRVACGGNLVADKSQLNAVDGDEVALLPPVSGG